MEYLLIGILSIVLALIILFGAVMWSRAEDKRARTTEFVEDSRLARSQRIRREKDSNGDAAQVYDYVLGATESKDRALRAKARAQNFIARGGMITLGGDGIRYFKDGVVEYEDYSIGDK